MIVDNSATRQSNEEPITSVWCCCNGVSNDAETSTFCYFNQLKHKCLTSVVTFNIPSLAHTIHKKDDFVTIFDFISVTMAKIGHLFN